MSGYVFPQFDDYDDPENFAFHIGQNNLGDHVEFGLNVTADFTNNQFDITEGKSFVIEDTATGSASNETRHRLVYGVFTDSETDVAFATTSGVNYIYVTPNISQQDSPLITVTDIEDSSNGLKVAEIDAVDETVTELKRDNDYITASEAPVTSVSGKTGDVSLDITKLDEAETFNESDVTVTSDKVKTSNDKLELGQFTDILDINVSNSSGDYSVGYYFGAVMETEIVIDNPPQNITQIELDIRSEGNGDVDIYIDEGGSNGSATTGTLVKSDWTTGTNPVSISTYTPSSNTITIGLYPASGWDTSSGSIDVTQIGYGTASGISATTYEGGSIYEEHDGANIVLTSAQIDALTASPTVSFPYPASITDWDKAAFSSTLDGGSVDVFIEEDDGSGFTEIAGPISSNDPIPAAAGSDVRFRVDISRSDTQSAPSLDALYRQWEV